jgi:pilus assembly protein Flp/PilA
VRRVLRGREKVATGVRLFPETLPTNSLTKLAIALQARTSAGGDSSIPAGGNGTMKSIVAFIADERGADIIEYALLAGLVSLAAVGTLTNVGTSIKGIYGKIIEELAKAPGGTLPAAGGN